jgi:hypothetical protein
MRTAILALPALAIACAVSSAKADESYQWFSDGPGACIAYMDSDDYFVPINCVEIVGPWWSFTGAAQNTTQYLFCDEQNWLSLQGWNEISRSETLSLQRDGIAYQTTGNYFTWSYLTLDSYGFGTPENPGDGIIALVNWDPTHRYVQGALGCTAGEPLIEAGDTDRQASSGRPVRYDFGEWSRISGKRGDDRRKVTRRVALTEGAKKNVQLMCPTGMVRAGGLEQAIGHTVKEAPDAKRAALTDVAIAAKPRRKGVMVTLEPNKLPYQSVAQLSIECLRVR